MGWGLVAAGLTILVVLLVVAALFGVPESYIDAALDAAARWQLRLGR